MKRKTIVTPLGPLIAIADEQKLYSLDFPDRKAVQNSEIEEGDNLILNLIEKELSLYFAGHLKKFETPIELQGTDFQKSVCETLLTIKFGQTTTYFEQARSMGKQKAIRAIASANGRNQIAIVIPCHRVIGSNGKLVGYSGGVDKKEWLLNHERNCLK